MFIVIGRTGCPYTDGAVKLLKIKKKSYKYYQNDSKAKLVQEYLKHVPSHHTTVPKIFESKNNNLYWIGGCTELKLFLSK
tara:strand:+ start:5133 stop:5372 length:240 start_codon:yes stop_codon:yes gene_type:complete